MIFRTEVPLFLCRFIDEGAVDSVCLLHENYCNDVRSLRQTTYWGGVASCSYGWYDERNKRGEYHADGENRPRNCSRASYSLEGSAYLSPSGTIFNYWGSGNLVSMYMELLYCCCDGDCYDHCIFSRKEMAWMAEYTLMDGIPSVRICYMHICSCCRFFSLS